jgi:hypothetical protein
MSAAPWNPIAGDGATICHFSDRTACTVVRVTPSGHTLYLQSDTATLDDWEPEFIPGGFAGHCVNNHGQRYTYEADPTAPLIRATRRKDGRFRTTNGQTVIPGRHQLHDYNF